MFTLQNASHNFLFFSFLATASSCQYPLLCQEHTQPQRFQFFQKKYNSINYSVTWDFWNSAVEQNKNLRNIIGGWMKDFIQTDARKSKSTYFPKGTFRGHQSHSSILPFVHPSIVYVSVAWVLDWGSKEAIVSKTDLVSALPELMLQTCIFITSASSTKAGFMGVTYSVHNT